MHDVAAVRFTQCQAQPVHDQRSDGGARVEVVVHPLAHRGSVDELRDDVALGRLGAGVVEDLEDVVVPQLRDRQRFSLEAGTRLFAVGEVGVEDFDRHLALEHGVVAAIHDRHPAVADFFDDLVLVEFRTGERWHRRGSPCARSGRVGARRMTTAGVAVGSSSARSVLRPVCSRLGPSREPAARRALCTGVHAPVLR